MVIGMPSKQEIELQRRIDEMERENARLKTEKAELEAKNAKGVSGGEGITKLQVSEKGALSAYGLGRWPQTLYPSQWIVLVESITTVLAFLDTNWEKFSWDKGPADRKADFKKRLGHLITRWDRFHKAEVEAELAARKPETTEAPQA